MEYKIFDIISFADFVKLEDKAINVSRVRHPFLQLPSDGLLSFMATVSNGTKQNTKKLRFTLLSAFFNYIHNSIDPDFQNPCYNSALRKLFRAGKPTQYKILEKDVAESDRSSPEICS